LLASTAQDAQINLWNAVGQKLIATLEGDAEPIAALLLADKTARLCGVDARTQIWQFTAPKSVSAVGFMGAGQLAVGQVDGAIQEIGARNILATLRGHQTYVPRLRQQVRAH
jgi:hypothetical protein